MENISVAGEFGRKPALSFDGIPSELGYGERGVPQAGIPGGATLVFVTDILGVN